MSPESLHPDLAALGWLVGEWTGEGRGTYPTIEDFTYSEALVVSHRGAARMSHGMTSLVNGRPSHSESGFWRVAGGDVELVLAHATGHVEVATALVDDDLIATRSTRILGSPTAKELTAIERTYRLRGDSLRFELKMQAVGMPLGVHLRSVLRRSG